MDQGDLDEDGFRTALDLGMPVDALFAGGPNPTGYGAFWGDVVYATRRTNPGAFTLWVFSDEDQGEPAFTTDIRRTSERVVLSLV